MTFNWRSMPSLASLRAFDATARHGGFAGAARSLNVTHAAVAQQVRALEADLGVRLAVRSGRSVGLTPAGQRLAKGLDKGFCAITESIDELRAQEARRGLRVNTTTFIAEGVIIPRLSEFWLKHPGVEVALLPSRDFVDIVREGFDFAIRAVMAGGKADFPGMEVTHLSEAQVVAVGAPLFVGETPRDAADYPWLWHEDFAQKRVLMEGAGLDVDTLQQVGIGDARLLLEATRKGLGLSLFNIRFVQDDLSSGRLRQVPLPQPVTADYYIVMPKGPRREIVDQFAAWLKTLF